ncbi:conjugal transfer protein TraF [Citrobacter freundii]|uniref:conjugal transfer protein TraF n=1 Tax=Citrobacter freundii TaxID=546 RepID=UPI00350EE2EA
MTFPAVYLASPDGQFAPIGQGPMSLPELNHRILVAAKNATAGSQTKSSIVHARYST